MSRHWYKSSMEMALDRIRGPIRRGTDQWDMYMEDGRAVRYLESTHLLRHGRRLNRFMVLRIRTHAGR